MKSKLRGFILVHVHSEPPYDKSLGACHVFTIPTQGNAEMLSLLYPHKIVRKFVYVTNRKDALAQAKEFQKKGEAKWKQGA